MKYSVLASSSRANCCFVQSGHGSFLIDAGLSGRATELRLKSIGVDIESIEAIFVTHEHRDHIHAAGILSRRLRIPVYANRATAEFIEKPFGVEYFETGVAFSWKGLEVSPFQISHDAADPVGFRFEDNICALGYATDIGRITPLLIHSLRQCAGLVLEANHDSVMLFDCQYPWQVKQRISSSHGHLSNDQAVGLLRKVAHPDLKCVVLAHLSEQSNTPEKVIGSLRSVASVVPAVEFYCGSSSMATPLVNLSGGSPATINSCANLDSAASNG